MRSLLILMLLFASLYGKLPNLKMADNNLSFGLIEEYEDYHIVATHYRTDKKELRYILANKIGYNALKANAKIMPEGSIVVKIGWSVEAMPTFPVALEAKDIQRVEYMLKDSKRFNHQGDHWGYARFIKEKGKYKSWDKGVQSCISCHKGAKSSDYLFTKIQKTF